MNHVHIPVATSWRGTITIQNHTCMYITSDLAHFVRQGQAHRRMQFVDVILWVYSTGLTLFIFPEYIWLLQYLKFYQGDI